MPQPNMQQMLKQVQKMQADMARAQEELADRRGRGVRRRRDGDGHA